MEKYYDLGYYPKATIVTFTASFYGTSSISFQNPQVLALDTVAYHLAIEKIKANGVDMKIGKRSAEGTVTAKKAQTPSLRPSLTIKDGQHRSDSKKDNTKAFQDALCEHPFTKRQTQGDL